MGKIDDIYKVMLQYEATAGISAAELSQKLNLDRANVSRYLNQLCNDGLAEKTNSRPVLYRSLKIKQQKKPDNSLDSLVGAAFSLQMPIQQAKAAILYPPHGLHTLILGETGVGKSMFAAAMCRFAKESKMINADAPFIQFNCADYADNPQLLIAQIFGVKKGAYSGADADRDGLLKKADQGVFFLDEVHRLSPQGQEMLFTFIDQGCFRPLGETSKLVYSDVQLIAATTEAPQSHLLMTFTRRIPMTITLPSLNERSLQERYFLINQFISHEAKRLNKEIYIQYNALVSFLLYHCPNNIGQLKSDIQLACAKAFLNFKAAKRSYILVEHCELPARVKRGIFALHECRTAIKSLFQEKEDILVFIPEGQKNSPDITEENEIEEASGYFYDVIEQKMARLKQQGMQETEINEVLNIDIEGYFKKYLSNLPGKFRREEILKVVGEPIVNIVEEIMEFAQAKLKREYDEKVYYGLALHLTKSLERIERGQKIYHPKLAKVRKQYADEFLAAIQIAKLIEQKFTVEIPFDEIGYITMFLINSECRQEGENKSQIQVLVIMHGQTTASSMAQVANTLVGGHNKVHSLDMPLHITVEQMYKEAKQKIIDIDNGFGVLLLVDMGSLNNFANLLTEETGIAVKCMDMVSTPVVIEAIHKAIEGASLTEVYQACKEITNYHLKIDNCKYSQHNFLIITACFTGEGAALRLKEIINEKLPAYDQVVFKSLDILDRNDFLCRVQALSQQYNIIAIVGTVTFQVQAIPFFSAADILAADGIKKLENLIKQEQECAKMKDSLSQHINDLDVAKLVERIKLIIDNLACKLSVELAYEVKIGILLHICFMVDKLVHEGTRLVFADYDEYYSQHKREFILAGKVLNTLERIYKINISQDELAYIVKMCLENDLASEKLE